jgi:hypothetical protein
MPVSNIDVLDAAGVTRNVSTLPALAQGAKTASLPVVIASDDDIQAKLGIVTETAPASDTASSGLNGRLQRVAQRLTSLIALLPTALGQTTKAASLPVTVASDEYALQPASSCNLLLSAAGSTNATSAKASAGALKGIQGYNAKTAAVYLKFYDKASAPTVGTDTPVKTLYLPPGTAFVFDFPEGFKFATGIAYALTGAAATADTTALTAGDIVCLNVDYI